MDQIEEDNAQRWLTFMIEHGSRPATIVTLLVDGGERRAVKTGLGSS